MSLKCNKNNQESIVMVKDSSHGLILINNLLLLFAFFSCERLQKLDLLKWLLLFFSGFVR